MDARAVYMAALESAGIELPTEEELAEAMESEVDTQEDDVETEEEVATEGTSFIDDILNNV